MFMLVTYIMLKATALIAHNAKNALFSAIGITFLNIISQTMAIATIVARNATVCSKDPLALGAANVNRLESSNAYSNFVKFPTIVLLNLAKWMALNTDIITLNLTKLSTQHACR